MSSEPRPHGALPDWGRADLPAPAPFTLRNILKSVGPGVIGLGLAIGSGEWLLGPAVIVNYGVVLLWITTVAVTLQVLLNVEMARYTLATGEPIVTGFMRTRPGPTFWGTWYAAAGFLQFGWPGWELFGCHRRAPWGRIDGMGLVLLLHGDQLAALTASEAVIRRATGAHQTWRRKVDDPLHPAERCLLWELA